MLLDELFNSSFFITITLAAVLVSLLYMYVSNKLQEMNKKIQTMVDIIRSVTQEMEMIKMGKPANSQMNNPLDAFMNQAFATQYPNLIPIDENIGEESEDSENSIEELDDGEDDESMDDDDDEDDDDEDDEDDEDEDEDEEEPQTKIINIDNDMVVEELQNVDVNPLDSEIKVLNINTEAETEVQKDLKKKKLPELKEMLKEKKPDLDLKNLKKDEIIEHIIN